MGGGPALGIFQPPQRPAGLAEGPTGSACYGVR
jgi:hypothetical protein